MQDEIKTFRFEDETIRRIAEEINAKKQELLSERVLDKVGIRIDLHVEALKRFPRIKLEYHTDDQSEHWFWNDGTENGLHLISFYPVPPSFKMRNKTHSVHVSFNHV